MLFAQHLGAFFSHAFEMCRIQTEGGYYRRGDLGGVSEGFDDLRLDLRRGEDQRHVAVVVGEAAMFGQFGAAGADHAVVGHRDEIGHAAILERVAIERGQRSAVKQLLDVQLGGIGLQVGLSGVVVIRLQIRLQPDELRVVADLEAMIAEAGRALNRCVRDCHAVLRVNRRLAVLGADDD